MHSKDAVNYNVMERQGLIEPFKGPAEAMRALGLIDASLLPATYYALFIRSKNVGPAAIAEEAQAGRHMARLPGLKGTLQLISREMMSSVYSFTQEDREDRARALLRGWGIGPDEHDRVRQAIIAALGGKEKTLPQLKNSLPASLPREIARRRGKRLERSTNIAVVAQAMGQRWELLRGGVGRSPFEDPGRYSLFERRFGRMRPDGSKSEALGALARHYVDRYGPASAEDFSYWTGAPAGDARRALELTPGISQVEIEAVPGTFFIAEDALKSLHAETFPVRLLASDDPYVKAYAQRGRFVPAPYSGAIMGRFGESASVVLVDGMVGGTWRLEDDKCQVDLFSGPVSKEKEVRMAAEAAGRFFTGKAVEAAIKF